MLAARKVVIGVIAGHLHQFAPLDVGGRWEALIMRERLRVAVASKLDGSLRLRLAVAGVARWRSLHIEWARREVVRASPVAWPGTGLRVRVPGYPSTTYHQRQYDVL